MTSVDCSHDHVVLLVTAAQFEDPPSWLKDNFTIIEGGTHAGGSSRNKLIIFKDGTYIELFNWITKPTEFLHWSDKEPGIIDFALTTISTTATDNYGAVSDRLSAKNGCGLDLTYLSRKAGGRQRKDGQEVRWEVTRPDSSPDRNGRTDVPFFCHDVTDREVRVPFNDATTVEHSCGASGIADIFVGVPQAQLDNYREALTCVTGEAAVETNYGKAYEFVLRSPTSENKTSRVSLRSAQVSSAQVMGLALHVGNRDGHGINTLNAEGVRSGISLIW